MTRAERRALTRIVRKPYAARRMKGISAHTVASLRGQGLLRPAVPDGKNDRWRREAGLRVRRPFVVETDAGEQSAKRAPLWPRLGPWPWSSASEAPMAEPRDASPLDLDTLAVGEVERNFIVDTSQYIDVAFIRAASGADAIAEVEGPEAHALARLFAAAPALLALARAQAAYIEALEAWAKDAIRHARTQDEDDALTSMSSVQALARTRAALVEARGKP